MEKNGWVPGAYEEEDCKQQTKNEPSDRYKSYSMVKREDRKNQRNIDTWQG
jgi:hypothetical protein